MDYVNDFKIVNYVNDLKIVNNVNDFIKSYLNDFKNCEIFKRFKNSKLCKRF